MQFDLAIQESALSAALYPLPRDAVLLVRRVTLKSYVARISIQINVGDAFLALTEASAATAQAALAPLLAITGIDPAELLQADGWDSVPDDVTYMQAIATSIEEEIFTEGKINVALLRSIESDVMDFVPAKPWSWWSFWRPKDRPELFLTIIFNGEQLVWSVVLERSGEQLARMYGTSLTETVRTALSKARIRPDTSHP